MRKWMMLWVGLFAIWTLPVYSADHMKIGVVLPMSGPIATYGQECNNGITLALEDVNAEGSVKIDFVTLDNKGDSSETAKSVIQAIEVEKVHMVIGAVASSNTMAGAKISADHKIPMLTPASTNDSITTKYGQYISRACFIDSFQGTVMATFAFRTLKARKTVMLVDKTSDYSVGLAAAFRKTFQQMGGEIIAEESFVAGEADFSALIAKVNAANPDAIFIPAYYGDVGPMIKQAGKTWKNLAILGGDGWDSPDLFKLAGGANRNNYISSHFSADDTDSAVQDFVTRYKARFNKLPGAMAALGYDAILVATDALKRAPSNNPQDLMKAINATQNLHGITGIITLDADRNADKSAVILEVTPRKFKFHSRVAPAAE